MKSWLYYAIGAAALSGVAVFWKYRYKFLRGKYERVKQSLDQTTEMRDINKEENERKQERDKERNQIFVNDNDADDKWSGVRKTKSS